MSNKRIKELRNLSKDELTNRIRESEAQIFEAKMKQTTGQLESVSLLWKTRKDLARMKMLLTQSGRAQATKR